MRFIGMPSRSTRGGSAHQQRLPGERRPMSRRHCEGPGTPPPPAAAAGDVIQGWSKPVDTHLLEPILAGRVPIGGEAVVDRPERVADHLSLARDAEEEILMECTHGVQLWGSRALEARPGARA